LGFVVSGAFMSEPASTAVIVVGAAGAGLAGLMAGFDGAAAIGSLCGALIYFSAAQELPIRKRLTFFVISFVMGYLSAPAMARAEMFGFGPIEIPALAAFVCSALIVTVTLATIRSRGHMPEQGG
jgi:hypothetical protein